ncbi:hypothetical protein CAEBREN_24733 [Caenorhabditis brenneri]|uniref:Uncharacterized protein n=1 Tax=Caenorhabditis brenneri TaxID=135651 RepID=G0MUB1_CAEBE|nr:hypothetical protein CAEBREN_24733 [Caenorhabditis brenneri]
MTAESSPESYNSDYLPVDLDSLDTLEVLDTTHTTTENTVAVVSLMEKCAVCGKPAFCYNYGVLSCNACKMFFRRVEVDKITYTCKYWNKCYDGLEFVDVKGTSPRCRACRYQRCVTVGMKYLPPGKPELELELINQADLQFTSLIGNLLFMDSRRRHKISNCYTPENCTLKEMVTRSKGSRMTLKTEDQRVDLHEWSFFGIYSSVELFMSFDFMDTICLEDKMVLLQNFALKSMLFTGAMRALAANVDRVMTPDGKDVYPDVMYKMGIFSADFLNGIRSRLVARLMELKVTNEEHVLLNVILFCNPALRPLSPATIKIITARQKAYSTALFQYCSLTYQQAGPCRFADLLALATILNKQHEDISYLTTLFQFYVPGLEYKKLFVEVCHK